MRQVLIVANRTVGGDELAQIITARHAAGPCQFHLLVPVPATPQLGVAMGFSAMELGMIPPSYGPDGRAVATERLQFGLEWMRELGVSVTGSVGEADAIRAVETVLHSRHIDEIIISTLPTSLSRWLRQDLPHRVERKFRLPVTVVTATSSPALG